MKSFPIEELAKKKNAVVAERDGHSLVELYNFADGAA